MDETFSVEAIDADHECPVAETLHHIAHEARFHRALRETLKLLRGDPHGEAADAGLPPGGGEHQLAVGRLEHPTIRHALLGDRAVAMKVEVFVVELDLPIAAARAAQ